MANPVAFLGYKRVWPSLLNMAKAFIFHLFLLLLCDRVLSVILVPGRDGRLQDLRINKRAEDANILAEILEDPSAMHSVDFTRATPEELSKVSTDFFKERASHAQLQQVNLILNRTRCNHSLGYLHKIVRDSLYPRSTASLDIPKTRRNIAFSGKRTTARVPTTPVRQLDEKDLLDSGMVFDMEPEEMAFGGKGSWRRDKHDDDSDIFGSGKTKPFTVVNGWATGRVDMGGLQ